MKRSVIALAAVLAPVFLGSPAGAQSVDPVLEREWWQRTDLREHIGQTYLQTFLADTVGLHAKIVADFDREVTIADADAVTTMLDGFDPRVSQRTYENFVDGETGFVKVLEGIEGTAIAADQVRDTLEPLVKGAATSGWESSALSAAEYLALIASGSGTLVILDDNNYFYNVGYQDPIRFSGRSFGRSGSRRMMDPSDRDLLNELSEYLGPGTADPWPFYAALLDILTSSDTRGISELPEDVQTLLTDFMIIYTAELTRNHMADLSPSQWAWQSDLAEVTLLTAYGGASGMAIKDGQLVECSVFAYDWEHGITERAAFMQLARLITQFEKANNPELVFDLIALTPLTDEEVVAFVDGDVLRRVVTFLNRPETQSIAQQNAAEIKSAMLALLKQIRRSSRHHRLSQGHVTGWRGDLRRRRQAYSLTDALTASIRSTDAAICAARADGSSATHWRRRYLTFRSAAPGMRRSIRSGSALRRV